MIYGRSVRRMYQAGDKLLYGTEGVCEIKEICEMKISSKKAKYYVLQPIYREGATLYVPFDNEALTAKMRPILTVDEINAMLDTICAENIHWIEDASERKSEFQRIMLSGDRLEILRMIRTLYLRRKRLQESGRRLRINDDQMLRDAEKLIDGEFALVLNISQRDVPGYIRQRVEEKI